MGPPDPALLALVAAVAFGGAIVLTKIGLRDMSALAGASVSLPTTAVLFWYLAPVYFNADSWNNEAAVIFAIVGLFFPAMVTLLVFEANRRMGATIASTISSISPLFAVGAALLLLNESLSAASATGITVIVIGVATLSWSRPGLARTWPLWTLLLPLGAAAVRGSAQALAKVGLLLWPDPFAATLIGYTVSAAIVLLLVFGIFQTKRSAYRSRALPWFVLAGLCNGLAVLMMYTAINRGTVTAVAPIVATYPVFTFLLSTLFLHDEPFTMMVAFGVGLTVVGVVLMALA